MKTPTETRSLIMWLKPKPYPAQPLGAPPSSDLAQPARNVVQLAPLCQGSSLMSACAQVTISVAAAAKHAARTRDRTVGTLITPPLLCPVAEQMRPHGQGQARGRKRRGEP